MLPTWGLFAQLMLGRHPSGLGSLWVTLHCVSDLVVSLALEMEKKCLGFLTVQNKEEKAKGFRYLPAHPRGMCRFEDFAQFAAKERALGYGVPVKWRRGQHAVLNPALVTVRRG